MIPPEDVPEIAQANLQRLLKTALPDGVFCFGGQYASPSPLKSISSAMSSSGQPANGRMHRASSMVMTSSGCLRTFAKLAGAWSLLT